MSQPIERHKKDSVRLDTIVKKRGYKYENEKKNGHINGSKFSVW